MRPARVVLHFVQRRHIEAAARAQSPTQFVATRGFPDRHGHGGNQDLPFSRCNDICEQRQRFGIDERDGAPDDHQRMPHGPFRRVERHPGQPQHRQHVGVVPFERHRKRQHVEVAHARLRLERHERGARSPPGGQLLFGRQEDTLAHDVGLGVEQTIRGLKAEVRHAHEVHVRERQRDSQAVRVRLADVAHLSREDLARVLTLCPAAHEGLGDGQRADEHWRAGQDAQLQASALSTAVGVPNLPRRPEPRPGEGRRGRTD